jgi:FkbM family methyltransferase
MTIRDLGWWCVRRLPWAESLAREVYARLPARLHDTPARRIESFFADQPEVCFVQIGAYDGVAGDPIHPLVVANPGWCGVLIEPQPDAFARLKQNYAGQNNRLHFFNVAVSEVPGFRDLYAIDPTERERLRLPEWCAEITSFDPEHLRRHFPCAMAVSQRVKVITFADAAAMLPGGRVDLVVLDVEGHERAILETIDWDAHQVTFVMFEHKHMSSQDWRAADMILTQRGFTLKQFGRDAIGFRRRNVAARRHWQSCCTAAIS